ncbi:hypothetical protein OSCI_3860022 [Kamptonema sp. PCC 6506]|nr:hypothetical protein OSCI_3860022 [Kamptonema sp. PCC 6506]
MGLTLQYQISSGVIRTVGPMLHCPWQPLACTVMPGTAAASKASSTSAAPFLRQDWYWQTNMQGGWGSELVRSPSISGMGQDFSSYSLIYLNNLLSGFLLRCGNLL